MRILCRLVRAWKDKHDVQMNGLLIDTLVGRFMKDNTDFSQNAVSRYDRMLLEFFTYLSKLPPQDYWMALGSNQRIDVKKPFQGKAKKAITLCQEAIEAEGTDEMTAKWRKLLGRFVPSSSADKNAEKYIDYIDTEEFIEDIYPVEIQHKLTLECEVTQNGFRPKWLND